MPKRPLRAAHPDIAERLRAVRTIYGPSLSEFCQTYGFSPSQWSNYEAGFKPSLAAVEQLIMQIDGLTLDWIYRGKTGGLTVMMLRILREELKA